MNIHKRWLTLLFSLILILMSFPGISYGESLSIPTETSAEETVEEVTTLQLSVTGVAGSVMLPPTLIEVEEGETAFSVLLKTLGEQVDYIGSGNSLYVRGIDGLAEFDHGPLSGWMYRVNGTFPTYSSGIYQVTAGDQVEWVYTTNGGKDVGLLSPLKTTEGNNRLREAAQTESVVDTQEPELANHQEEQSPVTFATQGQSFSQHSVQKVDLSKIISNLATWVLDHHYSGEWAALGIYKATGSVSRDYLEMTANFLRENNGEFRKVTDYERLVLGIRAAGGDPRDFAGYNLIEKIYNNERMTLQGSNGIIFGLIALDSARYDVPADALWTREKLLNWLLQNQNSDGSWALVAGFDGDVDITAMALAALAPYNRDAVNQARKKGFQWLSSQQADSGGFYSLGIETSESASQVIIALTSNGMDPTSPEFTKSGGNVVDNLLSYQQADGGFAHVPGGKSDHMAGEQALLALASYQNYLTGKPRLYDLGDINAPEIPHPDPEPQPDPDPKPHPKPDPNVKPKPTPNKNNPSGNKPKVVYQTFFVDGGLTGTKMLPQKPLLSAPSSGSVKKSGESSKPSEETLISSKYDVPRQVDSHSDVAAASTGTLSSSRNDSSQRGYLMILLGLLCAVMGTSIYLFGRRRGWR